MVPSGNVTCDYHSQQRTLAQLLLHAVSPSSSTHHPLLPHTTAAWPTTGYQAVRPPGALHAAGLEAGLPVPRDLYFIPTEGLEGA